MTAFPFPFPCPTFHPSQIFLCKRKIDPSKHHGVVDSVEGDVAQWFEQHIVPKLDVDATVEIGGQSKSSSHNIAFVSPATPESYGKQ